MTLNLANKPVRVCEDCGETRPPSARDLPQLLENGGAPGAAATTPELDNPYTTGVVMADPTRPTTDAPRWTVDPDTGCWNWTRYRDPNGYGRTYDQDAKKIIWAHRWSYEHHVGPIPAGLEIDHLCVNPPCVNPDHLEPVTRAENVRRIFERNGTDLIHLGAARRRSLGATYGDIAEALGYSSRTGAHGAVRAAIEKGLIAADELPPVLRLSESDVADIRTLYACGIPQTVIAEHYGRDSSQISRICRYQRWRAAS